MRSISVAVLIAGLALVGCKDTGSGEKIGVVTKIAKHGFFCKTWEGEIVRGGMTGGTGVNGQAFHFTVQDPALVEKVHESMLAQSEVKLTYRTEFSTVCKSESPDNAFLTNIEVLTPTAPQSGLVDTDDTLILQLLKVQAELISQLYNKSK